MSIYSISPNLGRIRSLMGEIIYMSGRRPEEIPLRLAKLSIIGSHAIWYDRGGTPAPEVTDAPWRMTPTEFWAIFLEELLPK